MNQNIILTVIELFLSLIIEGIILSMIFNWIANNQNDKQQKNLQKEMNNIEIQNKFIYTQLQNEIHETRRQILSQIKESAAASKKGGN
jgi:adenine-specific DNA methylase